MTRTVALALALLAAAVLPALAQDDAEPLDGAVANAVEVAPGVQAPANEAAVFRANAVIVNDAGQFAIVDGYVQTVDGWRRVTLCDDVVIPCASMVFRMEDVIQGDQFYLRPGA